VLLKVIFDKIVSNYIASIPDLSLKNTEKFLDECSIDRLQFEEHNFRSFKDSSHIPFYVSTIPRGMAGSTSDIDVILVSDVGKDLSIMTNHLFYEGRRVSIRFIRQLNLDEGINILAQFNKLPIDIRFDSLDNYIEQLPLKWEDFERLVNGVSFVTGNPYLHHLPSLCECALIGFLREYYQQKIMLNLACCADEFRTAHGYIVNALNAAMEILMVSCGQIQSKSKWTFYRWSRFRLDVTDSTVMEGISIIDSLTSCLHGCSYSLQKVLDNFGRLSSFFDKIFISMGNSDGMLFNMSSEIQIHEFIDSAVSLSSLRRTAVISSETLNMIAKMEVNNITKIEPSVAKVALKLVQFDLLSLNKIICY
jgi:hypothetical protein